MQSMKMLASEEVADMSIQLAHKVDVQPDLVVFVAKGAFQIGLILADFFSVPVLEATAERSGNRLKSLISPVLRWIPSGLKVWLRRREVESQVHFKHTERNVMIRVPEMMDTKAIKMILLVDDSVDTGHTVLAVRERLNECFPDAEVRIASLFLFSESKKVVQTDYWLYENVFFSAPWSNDSKYHQSFLEEYDRCKKAGKF